METTAQLWTDYGAFAVVAFVALMAIVFLYALVDAFSSVSRTMKEAFKLWDESERALHDFKRVIRRLEDLANEKTRGTE